MTSASAVLVFNVCLCVGQEPTDPPPPFDCADARSFCFERVGRRMLCLSGSTNLLVWEHGAAKPETIPLREAAKAHSSRAGMVACVGDGRHALISVDEGKLEVWDYEAKRKSRELAVGASFVGRFRISPDGRIAAAIAQAKADRSKRLVLWNVADWTPAGEIKGVGPIGDFAFAPAGDRLVLSVADFDSANPSDTAAIVEWDFKSSRESWRISYGPGVPSRIDASPDGRWIAVAGCETVRLQRNRVKLGGHLRVIDWQEKKQVAELFTQNDDYVQTVQFSEDGKTVYSGCFGRVPVRQGRSPGLCAFSVPEWKERWIAPTGFVLTDEIAVAPYGDMVLVKNLDALNVVRASTGQFLGPMMRFKHYPKLVR